MTPWHLFELSINFIEAAIILFFLTSSLGSKWESPKKRIAFWIAISIFSILISAENYYKYFSGFDSVLYISFLLIYTFLCLKQGPFAKALMVFLVMSMVHSTNTAVVTIYSLISHISIGKLASEQTFHRFFVILLTKVTFLLLAVSMSSVFRKEKWRPKQQILTLLIFSVTAFSGGAALKIASQNELTTGGEITLLTLMFAIWIIGVISYFICANIFREEHLRLKATAKSQMELYQTEELKDLQRHYKEIQSFRHDMLTHIGCLEELLRQNQFEQALHYLEEISSPILCTPAFWINTKNVEIDALLNSKFKELSLQGTDIKCIITGDMSVFDPILLCKIFGNLLSNVKEANEKIPKEFRKMEMGISNVKGFLHILIKNYINQSVLDLNPELSTLKSDRNSHGFGHQIIADSVEKLQGILYYYEKDKMFRFQCSNLSHSRWQVYQLSIRAMPGTPVSG